MWELNSLTLGRRRKPWLLSSLILSEGSKLEIQDTKSQTSYASIGAKNISDNPILQNCIHKQQKKKNPSIVRRTSTAHRQLITEPVLCITHIWSNSSSTHIADARPPVGMRTDDWKKTTTQHVWEEEHPKDIANKHLLWDITTLARSLAPTSQADGGHRSAESGKGQNKNWSHQCACGKERTTRHVIVAFPLQRQRKRTWSAAGTTGQTHIVIKSGGETHNYVSYRKWRYRFLLIWGSENRCEV